MGDIFSVGNVESIWKQIPASPLISSQSDGCDGAHTARGSSEGDTGGYSGNFLQVVFQYIISDSG